MDAAKFLDLYEAAVNKAIESPVNVISEIATHLADLHCVGRMREALASSSAEGKDSERLDAVSQYFNVIPTLTGNEERLAAEGVCPACKTCALREVTATSDGMRFMGCGRCKALTVLPSSTGKAPT